ncbi:MAG TPA: hypothetical protein VLE93_03385 [Candidatus Saccharimonadales bacterium]|nr:hypothetical protein [Candidatus Saccharimonadales bacterium]
MPTESGPQFLKEKYDLHNAPEVQTAAERTNRRNERAAQDGEEFETIGQDPAARIENYLRRFTEITKRTDPEKRERGLEAVKQLIFDKFVTKYEDVPESFKQLQERLIRERGAGGDWAGATDEQREQVIRQNAEAMIDDQQASLEQWIDYLASADSSYMPDYLKYWTVRSVLGLQEYDKENHKFPNRSRGTLKQFPDINQEALVYVTEALEKHFNGQKPEYEYDIQPEDRTRFEQFIEHQSFAKMYAWAVEQINPISEELLQVTEGQWHKFEQGSDSHALSDSIRGRSTGWCTAGQNTAKTQLEAGDFYIYYSNNEEGSPTIPRIAIRLETGKIAEVRGVAYKQNLDPYMGPILEEKLNEFPDKQQYLKKEHDMATLTALEQRAKAGEELTKIDLAFLYEIDSQIEGFGYQRDPRIKELRVGRNMEADMLTIFECEPAQIARSVAEINAETKAFVGKLEPGIFTKIAEHPAIEHLYTNFPEGKIARSELTIGGKTVDQLKAEMAEKQINTSSWAEDMLAKMPVLPNPEQITLIRLKVGDLGLTGQPTTDEIYARAAELGLELCPAEVGPHQRLKDTEQPLGDWYRVAMKQIADRFGSPDVFRLERNDHGLWLSDSIAEPDRRWDLDDQFVFGLRNVSPDSQAPEPFIPQFEF